MGGGREGKGREGERACNYDCNDLGRDKTLIPTEKNGAPVQRLSYSKKNLHDNLLGLHQRLKMILSENKRN